MVFFVIPWHVYSVSVPKTRSPFCTCPPTYSVQDELRTRLAGTRMRAASLHSNTSLEETLPGLLDQINKTIATISLPRCAVSEILRAWNEEQSSQVPYLEYLSFLGPGARPHTNTEEVSPCGLYDHSTHHGCGLSQFLGSPSIIY